MKRRSIKPAGEAPPPEPLHKPFTWHAIGHDSPFYRHAVLACRLRDLANGMRTALELIEQNGMRREDMADEQGTPVTPLLSPFDEGNLMRLCVAVAAMLAVDAERDLNSLRAHELRRLADAHEGAQ